MDERFLYAKSAGVLGGSYYVSVYVVSQCHASREEQVSKGWWNSIKIIIRACTKIGFSVSDFVHYHCPSCLNLSSLWQTRRYFNSSHSHWLAFVLQLRGEQRDYEFSFEWLSYIIIQNSSFVRDFYNKWLVFGWYFWTSSTYKFDFKGISAHPPSLPHKTSSWRNKHALLI